MRIGIDVGIAVGGAEQAHQAFAAPHEGAVGERHVLEGLAGGQLNRRRRGNI